MGNGGCAGKREDYSYWDPDKEWKPKHVIEIERNLEDMKEPTKKRSRRKSKKATATGTDPGPGTLHPTETATGEELWGWSEERIELPNGDKVYITPNDPGEPDGENNYFHDMPMDMILETYGVDAYAQEYRNRF